jgi:Uncharacterized conserved protein
MKILVSACLLGRKCKYNGGDNFNPAIAALGKEHELIPVCPETAGGLPVPRVPCEIIGGDVIDKSGVSRDREFRRGAEQCLAIAEKEHTDLAILQSRSPSCGVGRIYDGTFSGRLTEGSGVFASLLMEKGFKVTDSEDSEKDIDRLMKIDIAKFSSRYRVRCLHDSDIPVIFSLCKGNPQYYQYCPPFVTEESIRTDMKALPPGKEFSDKYYVGYFDGEKLIAVMDFIMAYPDDETAFIGFFMTEASLQGQGVGSGIIEELCQYLKCIGLSGIKLGWISGNRQAVSFWRKNGFTEAGVTYDTEHYTVTVASRALGGPDKG